MTTEITKIINGFKQFSETPYADAIKFLKEYIEVEESGEAFFELGKALFFNGEYDESIEWLEKSDDFRKDAYIGLDHYRKEDFKSAVRHFEKFLSQNSNETIRSYLMLSYERLGDLENAVRCGEMILEINPDNRSVKVRLIDYHLKLEQYQESLNYIDEMHDRKFRYKRGLALFHLGRYEDSINELKNLKTPEAFKLISRSYEKLDKPSKAARYLFKAYDMDESIETLFEIADFYLRNDNHEQYMKILNMILERDPYNEKCLEKIVIAYRNNGQSHLAVEHCKALLEANEKNIEAYITLSDAYYIRNDLEKTFEIIEKGLSIDPKSVALWKEKAWAHNITDHEQFKRDYEHIIRLEPNNTRNYTKLIDEYLWDDEIDKARRCYERLLLYNPTFEKSFDEMVADTAELKETSWMDIMPCL